VNIEIKFSTLETMLEEVTKHEKALSTIRTQAGKIQEILLDGNAGKWVIAMNANYKALKEHIGEMEEQAAKLRKFLKDYLREMTSIIKPKNPSQKMIVNDSSIKRQMENIEHFCQVKARMRQAATSYDKYQNHGIGSGLHADEEAVEKEKRNGSKMARIEKEDFSNYEDDLKAFCEDLQAIYKKVKKFNDTDKRYGDKVNTLYQALSTPIQIENDAQKARRQGIKDFGRGFLDSVKDLLPSRGRVHAYVRGGIVGLAIVDGKNLYEAFVNREAIIKEIQDFELYDIK